MGVVQAASGQEVDDRFFKAGGKEDSVGPFVRWICKRLHHTAFAAAATSEAVAAFVLPAHTIIHDAGFEVEEDFAGTSVTAATIALGPDGGDVDAIIEESDVFTGVANDILIDYNNFDGTPTLGVSLWDPTATNEHMLRHYISAETTYDATLVFTGGNVVASTAGAVRLYLLVSNPRAAFVLG